LLKQDPKPNSNYNLNLNFSHPEKLKYNKPKKNVTFFLPFENKKKDTNNIAENVNSNQILTNVKLMKNNVDNYEKLMNEVHLELQINKRKTIDVQSDFEIKKICHSLHDETNIINNMISSKPIKLEKVFT